MLIGCPYASAFWLPPTTRPIEILKLAAAAGSLAAVVTLLYMAWTDLRIEDVSVDGGRVVVTMHGPELYIALAACMRTCCKVLW